MTRTFTLFCIFLCFVASASSEIKIAVFNQPESLFYPIANDHVSDLITQLVVESLIEIDTKTNTVSPLLAKHWKVKKNKIEFTLDEKAKFFDDTPVTAEDVQNTFLAFQSKKIPSPDFDSQLGTVSKIKVLSQKKIIFEFSIDSPDHLRRLVWLPILPTNILNNSRGKNFAHSLSGSGPYIVESVEAGNKIVLLKNKNYWNLKAAKKNNKYRLEKITLKIIPDFNTQVEMLKNGSIDYLQVLSSKAWNTDFNGALFQQGNLKKLETHSKLDYQVVGIVWNMRNPLFQGVKTRLALAHLYPVKKFIENFFFNSYLQASGIFHPHSECHASENTPKEFNPEKAEKLLQEDGWVRNPDGFLYKNNRPFHFKLIVRQPASLRHLTLYQAELKKVGIQMTLDSQDWVVALNKVRSFDFEASEYSMDRPSLLSEYKTYWGSQGGLNYSGLSDKIVDDLLLKIDTEFQSKKRLELCKALDKRVSELAPLAFGWEQVYLRLAYSGHLNTTETPVYPYANWRNAFLHWERKAQIP